MKAGGTKMRFGRCPYCRAMICQNTTATVYYCSKCRSPIRGKNTKPTEDEADNALSSLEILSAVDTESVFSDEETDASGTQASVIDVDSDQPPPLSCGYNSNSDANSQGVTASSPSPYRGFGSPRGNGLPRGFDNERVSSNGHDEMVRSASNRVGQLRAASRRTRQASSNSDPSILRRRDFSVPEHEEAPGNAGGQQLRRSPLSSRELGTSASVSRLGSSTVTASPLTDLGFQRDLLHALDKLREMIATIELQSRSTNSGARGAVTRRESRIFRRLESKLAGELPAADASRWNTKNYASTGAASWSSASSSNGHGERHGARPRKKRHCFPLLGGAPFVVCGDCLKLLLAPNSTAPSRRGRSTKLRCGGCGEVLELTLPMAVGIAAQARRASRAACSATRASGSGSYDGSGELERAEGGSGGEQQVPLQLHRLLGYDSASQLLDSHRYSSTERF